MSKWNENKEGYADNTASIAVQRVSKEEGKCTMAKKRSCRRTMDENIIHDKAVKMRKMTDEQLVHYVEDRVAKAESEGYNRGIKREGDSIDIIRSFVDKIAELPGVGKATVKKITVLAKEEGYIEEY